VVEPARLVMPDARGLRLLYVVLTRATRRLVIVHAESLPESLGAVDDAPLGPAADDPAGSAVGAS
jgi:ATP-dependent exoDNAse (exonuclease V) beta subunit